MGQELKQAYYVDGTYGPRIVKFSYAKKTEKMYMGISFMKTLLGSQTWIQSQLPISSCNTTFNEAKDEAARRVNHLLDKAASDAIDYQKMLDKVLAAEEQ